MPVSDITLYTWPTPNGVKVSITLEELELPYKVEAIDISTNRQKEEWFLKINPNGRIPAITDGEQRVFESGAILLYLTDKYDTSRKISYPPGTPEYYEQLSWIMWQMGGLGPMQGQANHFSVYAPVRSDYAIKRYVEETKRLYDVLEARLMQSPFLAGEKYTIADIICFGWVRSSRIHLDFELGNWPSLNKWFDNILKRPAVQKGLKVPPPSKTEEEWKSIFADARKRILSKENTDRY